MQPGEAFSPTAASEDGPAPVATDAVAVEPDLVAVLAEAGRLEVRGDTLGPPRWTRARVHSFALSEDGADVAVIDHARDLGRPDLRVRVLYAKDGTTRASRDAKDRILREEHHTPAEDAEDGVRLGALCARTCTRTKDCPSNPFRTWLAGRRLASVSSDTATHLFDVPRQCRIGTLDLAVEASDLRASPKGAYAVFDRGALEVTSKVIWDTSTAQRVWSSPPRAP